MIETRWSRSYDGRATVLHAGRGRSWWWPGCPAVHDGSRTWVFGRVAMCWPTGPVVRVWRDAKGLAALDPAGRLLRPGQPATRLPALPQPGGSGRVWTSEGFLYASRDGRTVAIDALAPGESVSVGPHGAVLVGRGTFDRGALPGRVPRPLAAVLLPESVRWDLEGRQVAGVDPDGEGVRIDLQTGSVERRPGEVPVSTDVWLRDDRFVRNGRVLFDAVPETSVARFGDRLAGPGGVVWSLRERQMLFREPILALGATVGTPDGFVTVDWQTHRGWTVTPTGERCDPFELPVDPDDVIAIASWREGAVELETTMGARFRVHRGRVEPSDGALDPRDPPGPIPSPAGLLEPAWTDVVDGVRFAADEDGWLFAWPADQPAIEAS